MQHDGVIDDANGLAFLGDLNDFIAAIRSNNSGATAPADTTAFMWWVDTANDMLKQRNSTDTAWVDILKLSNGALPSVQSQAATAFTTAGTLTAYTLTTTPVAAALSGNQRYQVEWHATNGVNPTLARDGLTAKSLMIYGPSGAKAAPNPGTLVIGTKSDVIYDGTDYVVLSGYGVSSLGNNSSTVYTTGGSSTAYTVTPVPAYAAYATGMSIFVNFNAASGNNPTIAFNGIATPPNLVKENADGTYSNIAANDIPANHRSRVTLISATQALVERMVSAKLAGEVLQMVSFASDAGGSSTAGSTTNVSGSVKTITPRSANSIIVILCTFAARIPILAATNTVGTYQLMEGAGVVGDQQTIGVSTASGALSSEAPAAITARLTNSALTARSFSLGAATNNAGAPASATKQMFTITEIQA